MLVAVVRGTELAVANVGDSRGVLYDMDGKTHPLSFDHKPHHVRLSLFSFQTNCDYIRDMWVCVEGNSEVY